jgi:hypothetical protein
LAETRSRSTGFAAAFGQLCKGLLEIHHVTILSGLC